MFLKIAYRWNQLKKGELYEIQQKRSLICVLLFSQIISGLEFQDQQDSFHILFWYLTILVEIVKSCVFYKI